MRSLFWFSVIVAAAVAGSPLTTHSATGKEQQKLVDTKQQIEASQKKQQALKVETEKLGKELVPLKEDMVDLAEKIQQQEKTLDDLDDKIRILEGEKRKKTDELSTRQKQIETSVASMIRLSKTPPEAVVAMPGEIGKTLKAGQILSILTKNLQVESENLKGQLEELDVLEGKLKINQEKRERDRKYLESKQAELNQKIIARTQLQEKLFGEHRKESQRIKTLSKKSKTLQELVDKLERARREEATEPSSVRDKNIPTAALGKLRSFAKARGALKLPASGTVITRFGAAKAQNETSRGMELKVRENASVVALYDGEVVFTGPFMDYGSMVIVRHTDGYHSLIAGLSHIQCAPGDIVREGEPIGRVGAKSPSQPLYLELRKNSRPVDPGPWIRS